MREDGRCGSCGAELVPVPKPLLVEVSRLRPGHGRRSEGGVTTEACGWWLDVFSRG